MVLSIHDRGSQQIKRTGPGINPNSQFFWEKINNRPQNRQFIANSFMKTDGSLGFWLSDPVQGLGFGRFFDTSAPCECRERKTERGSHGSVSGWCLGFSVCTHLGLAVIVGF